MSEDIKNKQLQQFIAKYEPAKYKILQNGIEVRGVKDIHTNLARAQSIISNLNLGLVINHNAEMLSYGGFEVNSII